MNVLNAVTSIRQSSIPQLRTPASRPTVFVVDDDLSIRESLQWLIAEAGWRAEVFASAGEFLDRSHQAGPGCLVLDLSLPDVNGLELQRRIADRAGLPVIFITGHGDIPTTVQAMKAGAIDFLTKPYVPSRLIEMIHSALARSQSFPGRGNTPANLAYSSPVPYGART
jgi:FixJ family two-component response regulator